MTDTTAPTDAMLREQAIISVSSDPEVIKGAAQLEAYIAENKGVIMGCLSSLPGPILMLVKGLVKVVLIPLDFVVTLPLTKISNVLKDFSKTDPACTPPTPVQNDSDCAPPKIV